jgi:hypothetical protein
VAWLSLEAQHPHTYIPGAENFPVVFENYELDAAEHEGKEARLDGGRSPLVTSSHQRSYFVLFFLLTNAQLPSSAIKPGNVDFME